MNIYIKIITLICLNLIISNSCNKHSQETKFSNPKIEFSASEEYLKVINHYKKNPSDSLKLKAAIFLNNNSIDHFTYAGTTLDTIDHIFSELNQKFYKNKQIDSQFNEEIVKYCESQKLDIAFSRLRVERDLDVIQSDFIIENIDDAFKARNIFPWAKKVPFDDFCNYVLPYKIFMEPLQPSWRKEIMNEYKWVIDSLKNPNSIREATIFINKILQEKVSYTPLFKSYPLCITYKNLKLGRLGKCEHLVTFNTYVLRALGIPAMIDFTPSWGNNSSGHTWGSIRDEKGKLFTFDALYKESIPNYSSSSNFIPEGNLRVRRTSKIYRYTYDRQYSRIINKTYPIPQEFLNRNRKDVTQEYNIPLVNFTLSLDTLLQDDYIYLCVYNTNEWKISNHGKKIGKNSYKFGYIGSDIVYLPVLFHSSKFEPIASPFILHKNKSIEYLEPRFDYTHTLTLKRKSFFDYDLKVALKSMIGGVFQGSTKFKGPYHKLYEIRDIPAPATNEYNVVDKKLYRYVRFILPNTQCRVAEFYVTGFRAGKYIKGLPGQLFSSTPISNNTKTNVIDHNVLTYFVSSNMSKGYVGYDFGKDKASKITKIEFYPPNDGNSVEIGDNYELFYWNKKWVSLGKQVARNESLVFSSCPHNSIFRLRNLTKGYKERIFTYQNNNQIWW